ncbi:MAG TPA: ion transporter [Gemmatimonadaceae bacterium]|nr:ion transporter [Gemmatimonadaceae bacterium]
MTDDISQDEKIQLESERRSLLHTVSSGLETPMLLLGFIWLAIVILEFTVGLPSWLVNVNYAIWAMFILHFAVEFTIAPRKLEYLRENWITTIALLAPALRVFAAFRALRALRAARALRSARLVRVVGGINRGMQALGRVMGRRGVGYVAALSGLVVLAGAAGMLAFERGAPGSGIDGYGTALWWTAMVITTMGTDYFPRTPEGRLLCLLLALYGFAVFGYITATIASFFVARDAELEEGELPSARQIELLRSELAALRADLTGRSAG